VGYFDDGFRDRPTRVDSHEAYRVSDLGDAGYASDLVDYRRIVPVKPNGIISLNYLLCVCPV
jgi:hypothetical protein